MSSSYQNTDNKTILFEVTLRDKMSNCSDKPVLNGLSCDLEWDSAPKSAFCMI